MVKQRAHATIPAKPSGTPAGKSGTEPSADKSGATSPAQGPPPAFYQGLLDRMVKEHAVSEETLAQLATRRGEAIIAEMTAADGVDAKRVKLGEARLASSARAATDKAVTLQLELGVTK